MKLKFKQQGFQADAAQAVVDVFDGQINKSSSYTLDIGTHDQQMDIDTPADYLGWANRKLESFLDYDRLLENIRKIQINNFIKPSTKLEGDGLNLSIEMETGVGKTYTYIKTMYELYEKYGWSKFIIVVPSVAIREGVFKSFQVTEDHFASLYNHRIRYFIYDSSRLSDISSFASESKINVMIMNYQAFASKSEATRRIYSELDEFQSRRPIDIIKKTNPILILDEPQSLEGKTTKEKLKDFNALFTLRYSATHKNPYNMIYRLDAVDAYNKKLVKRIQVKGISQTALKGTDAYIYLDSLNISKAAPTANLEIEIKYKSSIKRKLKKLSEGDNLYIESNELEAYLDGYVISMIDGRDNSVEFTNGEKIYVGDVLGLVDEDTIRRIQIRETIKSHLEKERELFRKGIKVLSLFFIDEVANYRIYNDDNEASNGIYADIFEEEYHNVFSSFQLKYREEAYIKYLEKFDPKTTHQGYFSVDNKGRIKNTKGASKDDISTYDLIMKNKELLLHRDPDISPVRFIFSHSALKEGWDNPNVFQICTLKQSGSEVRKRQEVGRGLRLCVDENGERMDENVLGDGVQDVNTLTVVASESYDSFARSLQNEYYEESSGRARKIRPDLFEGITIKDNGGNPRVIDSDLALSIYDSLLKNDYVENQKLTEYYYRDVSLKAVNLGKDLSIYEDSIIELLGKIYDRDIDIKDARSENVESKIDDDKLYSKEFKSLWAKINQKTYYTVKFKSNELIENAATAINKNLKVKEIKYDIKTAYIDKLTGDKKDFDKNVVVVNEDSEINEYRTYNVKYDLIGKIAFETGLTRRDTVAILRAIKEDKFLEFKKNPEDFISKVSDIINSEKATKIIQHISYDLLEDTYDTDIFTEAKQKGQIGKNAVESKKGLFDYTIYDSEVERKFSEGLDSRSEVAVYVKLPSSFYVSTPVGRYSPDWAVAFYEGKVKHIYFVAETKGSMDSMELRAVEKAKTDCAKKHFEKISNGDYIYDVVESYEKLMDVVRG
ncbi:type III restriction-modification system endonuclease [Anaerococcus lactolyticus]|uniref:type III restriction-modification system endonuclease n=1 Tax=Anaerococcus lactolyticus TaxID=33032 RepID=UPI0023F44BD0|nr:DEAD/DEAH box helicase family protein [Anaerococcus lactolyticus]